MTQPRQDDANNQQESGENSEPQPPQQADDETASADKTGDEATDETVDEAADKEADEGAGSPADQDQDSGSASTDEAADDASRTDAEASDDTDAEEVDETDTGVSQTARPAEPDNPSTKRRRSSASTRRHRRSLGQTVSRGVGVLTSLALTAAVGGVAWWGYAAPTTPTPQLHHLRLPARAHQYVAGHRRWRHGVRHRHRPGQGRRGRQVGHLCRSEHPRRHRHLHEHRRGRYPHSRPRGRPGGQRRRGGDDSDQER